MAKQFEKKKLNREDHKQIDDDAKRARQVVKLVALATGVLTAVRNIPWKDIASKLKSFSKS